MKIYSLFDKVANKFVSTTLAESDEMFVRTSLFAICMDYAINDVEFYCVGYFDSDLGIIKPIAPRLCSWDCYKFPESRQSKDRFLTLEQIEEAAKKKKHEFIEKTTNDIKELEKLIIHAETELKKAESNKDKKRIKDLRNLIKETRNEINRLKEVA